MFWFRTLLFFAVSMIFMFLFMLFTLIWDFGIYPWEAMIWKTLLSGFVISLLMIFVTLIFENIAKD